VKVSSRLSRQIVKNSFLPLFIFLAFIGAYLCYRVKVMPTISAQLQQDLKKYLATISIICVSFIAQRVCSAFLFWYKENVAVKTETRLDDEMIPLIRKTTKIVIWAAAFLIILPFYGVNVSALIATLGVSSLAIALAAQDTIANIIAGFMIMVDRPFRIGDRIKLPGGEEVEVLDIGIRRSRFLSADKAIIIMPNLEMSKSKIVNYTFGEERMKGQSQSK
jgi:MscS family membrane protein